MLLNGSNIWLKAPWLPGPTSKENVQLHCPTWDESGQRRPLIEDTEAMYLVVFFSYLESETKVSNTQRCRPSNNN